MNRNAPEQVNPLIGYITGVAAPSRHPASFDSPTLLTQCKVATTRGSGPGGQHRNKVETAVVLEHQPTGIFARASERRSQVENRKVALFRLRINLAVEHREPVEARYEPSELWQSRCHGGKVRVNPRHTDFPTLLAEALDLLAHHGYDPRPAADRLGCTMTQLIKLLRLEPRAFAMVNAQRLSRGLHPLR